MSLIQISANKRTLSRRRRPAASVERSLLVPAPLHRRISTDSQDVLSHDDAPHVHSAAAASVRAAAPAQGRGCEEGTSPSHRLWCVYRGDTSGCRRTDGEWARCARGNVQGGKKGGGGNTVRGGSRLSSSSLGGTGRVWAGDMERGETDCVPGRVGCRCALLWRSKAWDDADGWLALLPAERAQDTDSQEG